jgi:hypothetical protein
MPRLEDVAILMQVNFKDIDFLFPVEFEEQSFFKQNATIPFDEVVIDFLSALSKELSKDPQVRAYPDVATFGFFCRKASILGLKKQYDNNENIRLGRGVIFHIAPSNVPVNFAYSYAAGLLAGNVNIVRVPSKNFDQISIIINVIKRLSESGIYKEILEKTAFIRYDKQSSVTKYFSSKCDIRVIWGGDETIARIRKEPLPARSFDVTFADRYSLCIINADRYVNEGDKGKIVNGFYNDTYLFDQNACTAPHLIVWTGSKENVTEAKEEFWKELHDVVKKRYDVQPVIAVDKLTAFYKQAVFGNGITRSQTEDNLIWRVELKELTQDIDEFRCTSGYFSEYHASCLSEISKIINRKYQTLAYYGFEKSELKDFILQEKPNGIDRIVPIGRTSDFSLVWDGFNLIDKLSRFVDIQ